MWSVCRDIQLFLRGCCELHGELAQNESMHSSVILSSALRRELFEQIIFLLHISVYCSLRRTQHEVCVIRGRNRPASMTIHRSLSRRMPDRRWDPSELASRLPHEV